MLFDEGSTTTCLSGYFNILSIINAVVPLSPPNSKTQQSLGKNFAINSCSGLSINLLGLASLISICSKC